MRNEDVDREEAEAIIVREFEENNRDYEVTLYNLGAELDYAYDLANIVHRVGLKTWKLELSQKQNG